MFTYLKQFFASFENKINVYSKNLSREFRKMFINIYLKQMLNVKTIDVYQKCTMCKKNRNQHTDLNNVNHLLKKVKAYENIPNVYENARCV